MGAAVEAERLGAAVSAVRAALRGRIEGIAVFGSRGAGTAGPDSDLDLAVLPRTKLDPVALWDLAQRVAGQVHLEVDLVDLWQASTVLQHEIVTKGRWVHAEDPTACALFEARTLTRYGHLNEERLGILSDYVRSAEGTRG